MIWKLCKLLALVPLLLVSLALFVLPLLAYPWYCSLGAFLLMVVCVWFWFRRRRSGVAVPDGSVRDPWSRKSEVINW